MLDYQSAINEFAKIWNELPNSVITALNIEDFKSQMDSDEVSISFYK